jgi:penicillin amidase
MARFTWKRLALFAAILVAVFVLVPAGFLALTLLRASGGLPEWQAAVELDGLAGPVDILRDENAVPHIFAVTERDAFFAQGFVHAQDRLWQMQAGRQALSGRMAEWLGPLALPGDRLNRALRYAATARADYERLPAEDKALLIAYADGVNAYLASDLYRRPPEMVVLHVEPAPWAPHDSLLIQRGVNSLLMSFGQELNAQRFVLHGSDPRAPAALDPPPFEHRPIIETAGAASAGAPRDATAIPVKEKSYSDSWVLTGEFTTSGKPLLANDPQLASTLPSFWYLLHMSIDGENRVGATLPGMPVIAVGRTDRIAWGVTNGMVDQADAMLLYGDPQDRNRYRRAATDDWQQFVTHEEVFEVRFGEPVRETFRRTPLGVILPPDVLTLPVTDDADAHIEARIAYLDGDSSWSALLRLNRARDVASAVAALADFTGPALNITLADVDGGVGYVSAGRYVQRTGDAARIVDYAPRDSSEWTPLPYAENPQSQAPVNGRFVTANQPPVGPDYPHYVSDAWPAPYRTLRVHELLDERPKHDVESFLAMQRDTLSVPARWAVPKLLARAPHEVSGVGAAMLDVLRDWDYRFTADTAGPTVFLTWLRTLHEELARDEMGELLWPRGALEPLPSIVFQVLDGRHQEWCATAGSDTSPDCDAVLRTSLAGAARRLEDAFGPDAAGWRWSDAAAIEHPHGVFTGLPILGGMFSRTANYPGGPDTLMTMYVDVGNAPHFTHAFASSSLQAVYDLANLDASRYMISTGQSGHFRSPYYDNYLPRFAAGERIRIPTAREEIEPLATLKLTPIP